VGLRWPCRRQSYSRYQNDLETFRRGTIVITRVQSSDPDILSSIFLWPSTWNSARTSFWTSFIHHWPGNQTIVCTVTSSHPDCVFLHLVSLGGSTVEEHVLLLPVWRWQCRDEFKHRKITYIEGKLGFRMQSRMPERLRQFFGGSKKAIVAKLQQYEWWHRLQNDIGWLAIVFSKLYSIDLITHASVFAFEKFVQTFAIYRPKIVEAIEELWINFPTFLMQSGSIILIWQCWQCDRVICVDWRAAEVYTIISCRRSSCIHRRPW